MLRKHDVAAAWSSRCCLDQHEPPLIEQRGAASTPGSPIRFFAAGTASSTPNAPCSKLAITTPRSTSWPLHDLEAKARSCDWTHRQLWTLRWQGRSRRPAVVIGARELQTTWREVVRRDEPIANDHGWASSIRAVLSRGCSPRIRWMTSSPSCCTTLPHRRTIAHCSLHTTQMAPSSPRDEGRDTRSQTQAVGRASAARAGNDCRSWNCCAGGCLVLGAREGQQRQYQGCGTPLQVR